MNAWGLELERIASTATVTCKTQRCVSRAILQEHYGMTETYAAVCSILESDREGDTAGKLSMQLTFRRTSANGTPRD